MGYAYSLNEIVVKTHGSVSDRPRVWYLRPDEQFPSPAYLYYCFIAGGHKQEHLCPMSSAGGRFLWWLASHPDILLLGRFVSFLIAPHRAHKTYYMTHVLTFVWNHDRSPAIDNT
jgi:hypothetical protein